MIRILMVIGIILLIASFWVEQYSGSLYKTAWVFIAISLVLAFGTAIIEVNNKKKNE